MIIFSVPLFLYKCLHLKRYIVSFLCSIRIGDTRWGQFITACTQRQASNQTFTPTSDSEAPCVWALGGSQSAHGKPTQSQGEHAQISLYDALNILQLCPRTPLLWMSPSNPTLAQRRCVTVPMSLSEYLFFMLHFFSQSVTVIREKEASNQQEGCTQYEHWVQEQNNFSTPGMTHE